MSGYPTILVHLTDDPGAEDRFAFGCALAHRFQSHLTALYTAQPISVAAVECANSQGFLTESLEISRERGKRLQVEIERMDEQRGAKTQWCWDEGNPMNSLRTHAVTTDLLIVGHSKSEDGRVVFYAPENIVLQTGCPVMMLSQPVKTEQWPQKAVIIWQATPHCLRAIRDSLPLIKQARHVKVVGADADPEILVVFLKRHGVTPHSVDQPPLVPGNPGELLHYVETVGCDFLVIGADGYRQQYNALPGRVTKEIAEKVALPVLWSH